MAVWCLAWAIPLLCASGLAASCSIETGATGLPTAWITPHDTDNATGDVDAAVDNGGSASASATGPSNTGIAPASSGATNGVDAATIGTPTHDAGSFALPSKDASDVAPPKSPFPAIADPWQEGPYDWTTQTGPNGSTVSFPSQLGAHGLHHPIVVRDNAGGIIGPSVYLSLDQQLASYGFVVYAAFSSSAQGSELRDGIDWLLAENARPASTFFDKLDEDKISLVGHALGSIAAFTVAADPRVSTSVHIAGATNQTVGQGHALLQGLHAPAAFFCDAAGGNSFAYGDPNASCQWDFDHSSTPVFLATVNGSELANMNGAIVAWLGWLLLDDPGMKPMFAGGGCTLCSRQGWSQVQQRGLDGLP